MKPTFQENGVEIYQGDCREVLRSLPDESVNCVVTSPPYWGLRQYLFDKASVVREDLTEEQLAYVGAEIQRLGIKPRIQAPGT